MKTSPQKSADPTDIGSGAKTQFASHSIARGLSADKANASLAQHIIRHHIAGT